MTPNQHTTAPQMPDYPQGVRVAARQDAYNPEGRWVLVGSTRMSPANARALARRITDAAEFANAARLDIREF
jgi:hypothetical protein